MKRPLLDLGSQTAFIVAQLFERLVLTGALVRYIGVTGFERWSLILAAVSLLSMVDLGAQVTFSNRMAKAAHSGDTSLAARIYRESNAIFFSLALLVAATSALIAFSPPLQRLFGLGSSLGSEEQLVTLLLGISVATRLAGSNLIGAYRATLALARGTLIMSAADIIRSIVATVVVVFSPSLIAAALIMAVGNVVAFLWWVPRDIARRTPEFRQLPLVPSRTTLEGSLGESLLYSSQFLSTVVLVQVPVLLVGSRAAAGVLASFVLIRTVANLSRQLIQRFSIVVGIEFSRLEVQGRQEDLQSAYLWCERTAAYLFGFSCAFLLAWGDWLVRIWTGTTHLYDPVLLAVLLAPLVITPGIQIALYFAMFSQRPKAVAASLTLQLVVAAPLALFLPIADIALRMAVAISASEMLALTPILYASVGRALGVPIIRVIATSAARALAVAAITYVAIVQFRELLPGLPGLFVSGLACGLVVAALVARSLIAKRAQMQAAAAGQG